MYDELYEGDCQRNQPPRPPRPRKVGDIFLYQVRPGDNVFRLARMFNSTVDFIRCMNNLNNQMMIFPGQNLLVPVINQQVMPRSEQESYELYF